MSQNDRLLRRLHQGTMCAMEPLEWSPRITRVAARVKDLRDAGHEIQTFTECYLHVESERHAQYKLLDQDQGSLF